MVEIKKKIQKLSKMKRKEVFSRLVLYLLQRFRILIYRHLYSENTASLQRVRINQPTIFNGKGTIKIEEGAIIGFRTSPYFLSGYTYLEARGEKASLIIGEKTFLNNSSSIIVDKTRISIGKRCFIGTNFSCIDSDFHGIKIEDRASSNYDCREVIIEDDIFIGNDVKVLKGVIISSGAIIGSGSIVTSNVEPNAIYAGCPAKKLRDIND